VPRIWSAPSTPTTANLESTRDVGTPVAPSSKAAASSARNLVDVGVAAPQLVDAVQSGLSDDVGELRTVAHQCALAEVGPQEPLADLAAQALRRAEGDHPARVESVGRPGRGERSLRVELASLAPKAVVQCGGPFQGEGVLVGHELVEG
jgi:hypothetical protein